MWRSWSELRRQLGPRYTSSSSWVGHQSAHGCPPGKTTEWVVTDACVCSSVCVCVRTVSERSHFSLNVRKIRSRMTLRKSGLTQSNFLIFFCFAFSTQATALVSVPQLDVTVKTQASWKPAVFIHCFSLFLLPSVRQISCTCSQSTNRTIVVST